MTTHASLRLELFVLGLGLGEAKDRVQCQGGLGGVHTDAADAGEEFAKFVPHQWQAA